MEQFEQLLTCAICLDRYRNPKLLPCQHSFCMEPCMDGLVDYVRRQVKCPECRAEHRIPYQGVQGYPTNVTLQRFLELHIEITGEQPDPTSGQVMRRCAVCTEKSYCCHCMHCGKEVCPQCKAAHMDILRREISRINNQVRRSLHRLEDMLAMVEKNTLALQTNTSSVSEEVDEIYRRLSKALKDRTEYLTGEIDRYLSTELRNLMTLKDNLEVEIANIQSNCDLADKHMQSEEVDWEDCELLDAKEIFLKTVEFIRNFEAELGDYTRRMRFSMAHDPNQLVHHVATYGDLNIGVSPHQFAGSGTGGVQQLQPPGPGLLRSKSDHRLASQFRQQDERGEMMDASGRLSPLGGRKFGERYQRPERYGRNSDREYYGEYEGYEESRPSARSRLRARLRHGADTDSDNDTQGRSVRFNENNPPQKERERVLDTEDVVKGPLSGITRLYDSPRVIQRLHETQVKKDKPEPPVQEKPKPQPPPKRPTPVAAAQRQVSEEDEITKIKRQMKNAPGEVQQPAATAAAVVERPGSERVAALRREEEQPPSPASSRSSPASDQSAKGTPPAQPAQNVSGSDDSDESSPASVPQSPAPTQRKTSVTKPPQTQTTHSPSRRSSASSDVSNITGAAVSALKKTGRSASTDSSGSTESTTDHAKQKFGKPTEQPRFQSRFLPGGSRATGTAVEKTTKEEEEESSSETSSSSEESESEDEAVKPKAVVDNTDIAPLLARSAQARDSSRKSSRDESYTAPTSRYAPEPSSYRPSAYVRERQHEDPPAFMSRTRAATSSSLPSVTNDDNTTPSSRYGSSGFTSRFLNKSKSSAVVSPEEEDPGTSRRFGTSSSSTPSSTTNQSPRSRYTALKERRARLARSRSTHNLGVDDDDDDDDVVAANSPAAYLAGKYGTNNELTRSRSTHAIKSRETTPERPSNTGSSHLGGSGTSGEKDGAALSSWARYLKNKYGVRGKDGSGAGGSSSSSTVPNSRRLSLGLPLRGEVSDDDQKNSPGSPTSPTQHPLHQGFAVNSGTRSQYAAKRRQVFSVGSRGSEPGCFTWPRGVATGPDNSIVVADSSNHRVQVFDSNGIFLKEFGGYGNGEGEFDCLAGVAVNRIGQFIIADRYNHRIQVMDPSGRFLRAFGSQGTSDGKFNYPWGVTTDALGFIYVCDKENHRVQVFQSDGTFVGKFGSHGSKVGQLDHPHYIAVSNTNRVIVSDSNNHRIQIFDVNGRVLSSFGQEGSEESQFKFPRSKSYSSPLSSRRRISRPMSLAASVLRGSGGRRPGIHTGGGLWQQPDPDLYIGGGIHPSLRMLGQRRGRIQGVGGCGSNVQLKYPSLRPGKPQNSSLLRSASLGSSHMKAYDPPVIARMKMGAILTQPYRLPHSSVPLVPGAALLLQRRMSIGSI